MAGYVGTKSVILSTDAAKVGGDANVTGTVTAASFVGDGSALTGLPAGYTNADADAHLNTSTATTGEYLQWNGSDYNWAGVDAFPSGTRMLFQQTTAPTGWTKDTTHNNKALRVVSGTAGSGGSQSFTSAFSSRSTNSVATSGTVSNHTLTTAEIPSHTHTYTLPRGDANWNGGSGNSFWGSSPTTTRTTNSTGGGGSHSHGFTGSSHSHTLDMAVQYVDLIIATKD